MSAEQVTIAAIAHHWGNRVMAGLAAFGIYFLLTQLPEEYRVFESQLVKVDQRVNIDGTDGVAWCDEYADKFRAKQKKDSK